MIELGPLALGTAPIGGLYEAVEEETARAVVDRAWELGIRYFDTAPLLRRRARRAAARCRPQRSAEGRVRRLDQGGPAAATGQVRVGWGAGARRLLRLLVRCHAPLARGEPRPARSRPRRHRLRPRPGRTLRRGARRLVSASAAAARRGGRAGDRRGGQPADGALSLRARGRPGLLPRRGPLHGARPNGRGGAAPALRG